MIRMLVRSGVQRQQVSLFSSLPFEIGQLTSLTELYLNGNRLNSMAPKIRHLADNTMLAPDSSILPMQSPANE
jgi:Leucine-rich repeat (LRR) protein